MPVALDQIPPVAARASVALRDELLSILGDDLVAMWMHGGTTFADRPLQPGDLDICAVLARVAPNERRSRDWRDDPSSRPYRIYAAERALAEEHGVAFDTTYLLIEGARRGEPPSNAFRSSRGHVSLPVERAHWLAGQYVHLYGSHPDDLVDPPTAEELRYALDRELEHLERHVYEGDASNPYEATYALWNGCRILHTLETGSPVLSKRSAGMWGLAHLPERWHDAIHAANRSYDGLAGDEDNEILRRNMAPFVEMVRERLPPTDDRSPEEPPRWS